MVFKIDQAIEIKNDSWTLDSTLEIERRFLKVTLKKVATVTNLKRWIWNFVGGVNAFFQNFGIYQFAMVR